MLQGKTVRLPQKVPFYWKCYFSWEQREERQCKNFSQWKILRNECYFIYRSTMSLSLHGQGLPWEPVQERYHKEVNGHLACADISSISKHYKTKLLCYLTYQKFQTFSFSDSFHFSSFSARCRNGCTSFVGTGCCLWHPAHTSIPWGRGCRYWVHLCVLFFETWNIKYIKYKVYKMKCQDHISTRPVETQAGRSSLSRDTE